MKKGFTLIELLGVIIIISILLILIVPNVNKAIQNSAKNVFKRNVQSMYNYVSKDVVDNERVLPSYYVYFEESFGYSEDTHSFEKINDEFRLEDAYGFVTVNEDGKINIGISYREDYCVTNFILSDDGEDKVLITTYRRNSGLISGDYIKNIKIVDYKGSSCEAQSDIP